MAVYEEKESYATSRAGGIGGTDAAAILGLSPWKRPIDIYAGKINPGAQLELDKECLYWGSALEPIVRGRYAERFGVAVTAPQDLAPLFPKSRPWRDSTLIVGAEDWMLGAPDGWIPSVRHGLEIKCSSRKSDEWGDEGSEDVPSHYYVQAAWYAAVCDAKGWNFGVLFSGNTLVQYHIKRDLALERDMIEACKSFWFDNVLKQVEPAIDESESYGRYLARKFSLNTGKILQPTPEILKWTAEMKRADDEEKEAAENKQEANNHLRALIGDAWKCVTPLGTVGWVRPEKKDVTDFAAVGKELGPLHPEIVAKHTKEEQGTAYLRAWYKK
jgi:predicted phage-related endonuclease